LSLQVEWLNLSLDPALLSSLQPSSTPQRPEDKNDDDKDEDEDDDDEDYNDDEIDDDIDDDDEDCMEDEEYEDEGEDEGDEGEDEGEAKEDTKKTAPKKRGRIRSNLKNAPRWAAYARKRQGIAPQPRTLLQTPVAIERRRLRQLKKVLRKEEFAKYRARQREQKNAIALANNAKEMLRLMHEPVERKERGKKRKGSKRKNSEHFGPATALLADQVDTNFLLSTLGLTKTQARRAKQKETLDAAKDSNLIRSRMRPVVRHKTTEV
jgi:hypothetical protein